MPIIYDFEYHRPKTLKEALELLAKYKGEAAVLAGGTDLLVRMKENLQMPKAVIDIKKAKGLPGLKISAKNMTIGALATFAEMLESDELREKYPLIWEAARTVGSTGVRNRATMAGNICSAVPSLDSGPALLAYEATITVQSVKGKREISIADWFTGPRKTALNHGELVTEINVPLPSKKCGAVYAKLGRYRGEDLAQACVGVLVFEDALGCRIALGALGPAPKRAATIEKFLAGKELSEENIAAASALVDAEISPITDIRATREYRLHMARILLERALREAKNRLEGRNTMPVGASVLE